MRLRLRLRNGSVLPSSSDVISVTQSNGAHCSSDGTGSQQPSSVLPQSHPVPFDNQTLLTNALLSLMEQNKVLLSRLVNDNSLPLEENNIVPL